MLRVLRLGNPDANPYELVTAAMKETAMRLAGTGAMGRPWLKDDYGVDYGVDEVKAEIKAAGRRGSVSVAVERQQ